MFFIIGCASMTGSKNQPISITTSSDNGPVSGATCVLTNDKGQWFVTSPGSVVVQKSTEDLCVVCKKENHSGNSSFPSKSNGGVWGNVVAGGLIGYAVDSSSGAGFDYPSVINVHMTEASNAPLIPAKCASN